MEWQKHISIIIVAFALVISWVDVTEPVSSKILKQQPLTGYAISEESKVLKSDKRFLGLKRISHYCQYCNDGNTTSTGESLDRSAAYNESIPYFTPIYVEGYGSYTIKDKCGKSEQDGGETIDLFHWSSIGRCDCSEMGISYNRVWIKE